MNEIIRHFGGREHGLLAVVLGICCLAFLQGTVFAQCINCTTIMGGGYTSHVFQSGSDTFIPPTGVTSIEYLVVGGGGGGSGGRGPVPWNGTVARGGTGGDAGGVQSGNLPVIPFSTYGISVGTGGSGGDSDWNGGADPGTAGEASTFATLVTAFGGAGGVTATQAGGGSGGDGASGPGVTGVASSGGNGGDGLLSLITGSSVAYGGGGGGGGADAAGGTGGVGGGGDGGADDEGIDAIAGSGSGGGGGGVNIQNWGGGPGYAGGDGGSGIVVIRYVTPIPPLPPVAVIEYHMDESDWDGSAGEVLDSSGNGNHGTANDDATTDSGNSAIAGDPGTCAYGTFDDNGDYIDVPGLSNTLNATASLAFWIRTNQDGENLGWQAPGIAGVEEAGGGDDIFWGWLDANGRIGISVGNDYTTKSSIPINNGTWRHIVLTRDHTLGEFKIYIDGVLNVSGTITGGVIGNGYSSIGRIENTGEEFDGQLDEVRVYDGILTDAEVVSIMEDTHPCAASFCPLGIPEGGLLGEYYNGMALAGAPVGERVDGPVDFDWATGAPGVAGIGVDGFSVEWNGFVRVTDSGNYRFRTVSDDGVRLWVNNQLLIDHWDDHGPATDTSGNINLTAGEAYPITLQYYENGGGALIRLHWNPPGGGNNYAPIPAGPDPLGDGLYYCAPPTVDHYRISHSGSGITCEGEPITISAHNADGSYFAPVAGTQVILATEPDSGTWAGGNTYIFSGAESSFVKYLRQITPMTLDIDVGDGIAIEAVPIDPPITFTDIALRFYGDSARSAMPNQVAGVEDPNLVVAVLETDTETGACVARLDDSDGKDVKLAYECRDPITCSSGQTLSINGGPGIQGIDSSAAIIYSTVNLDFGPDGFAGIPFRYSDVGRIKLLGQIELEEDGNDPAITVTGSSSEFVVRPYTLAITAVETSAGVANPSTEGSGTGFVAAGEQFVVRVEGRNAQGAVTPAFGREMTPENVAVNTAGLVFPAGGNLGTLTNGGAFSPVVAVPGVYENSSLDWNQVGSLTLVPSLTDGNYLNAGDLASVPNPSGTIGRFYPFDYHLSAATATDGCGSFTYMSQPAIELDYSVQARGKSGGIVSNYDTGLGYGGATPSYVAENANDGTPLGGRVIPGVGGIWTGGVFALDTTASFIRAAALESPYTQLQLGLQIADTLDTRSLVALDLDMLPSTSSDCVADGDCDAEALGSTLDVRFGRLRLASGFGPETADLPTTFVTEYWNGVRWLPSTGDSCTRIVTTGIIYNESTPTESSLASDASVTIGGGTTQGNYIDINLTDGFVDFVSGRGLDSFEAPGAGNTGSFTVDVPVASWLGFDWDQNGNHTDANLPTATFTFGSYRGHDRIIYWQEVLQ